MSVLYRFGSAQKWLCVVRVSRSKSYVFSGSLPTLTAKSLGLRSLGECKETEAAGKVVLV